MIITGIYVEIPDLSVSKHKKLKFVWLYSMGALAEELLSLFCSLAGRPVGRLVSQCVFQISEFKLYLTHSISQCFPAQSQPRLQFSTNYFPAIRSEANPVQA